MATLKVLIVEDELIIAEDLTLLLREQGHIVVGAASTGEEGLQIARREQIDLAIVDLHLKGKLDGIQTIKLLDPIPYILTTGQLSSEMKSHICLEKPFVAEDLLNAIERVLCENYTPV